MLNVGDRLINHNFTIEIQEISGFGVRYLYIRPDKTSASYNTDSHPEMFAKVLERGGWKKVEVEEEEVL